MFMGFPLIPGDTAVQCFFVVSGFYMSMVLNGKYSNASYWLFISNRLLRLYPIYFTVLIATLLLTVRVLPGIDPLGWLYFAFSQITIFGQDAEMFLFVNDKASLAFTANFHLMHHNLFEFAPIPQAWSLGIELWFYLLAPFILKRSPLFLVSLLAASLLLRLFLQLAFGLSEDPWSYRFFPSELALFLLGAIAHRADRKALIVAAIAVAAVLFFNRPGGVGRAVSVAFIAVAAISIPWLFAMTKNIEADKFLGELSYPIYLIHLLVGALISGPRGALIVTIASSVILYLLVDRPIDR
jgi:peptidoglycan/LPS O-acetylase OafA/YrhL